MVLRLLAAALGGYLLGSIPFGYLIGRLRGVDIRQYGSGATGGTNVQRTLGWGPALVTGLGDVLKGAAGAWLGARLGGEWGYAAGALGAVLGHSYPVWLGFRGGKSVATGAGGLVLQYPLAILAALVAALAVIFPTRYVSLGSITAALVALVYMLILAPLEHKVLTVAVVAVILWRHRSNMQRLLAGKENKFGQKARPRTE